MSRRSGNWRAKRDCSMKKIDLSKSVFELTESYPELIAILKELGFHGLANPALRATLGKVTTLPQGCVRQGRDLAEVIAVFKQHGFEIESKASRSGVSTEKLS